MICLHSQKHRGSVRKKCRFHRGRLLHSVKAFLVSVKAKVHPYLHRKYLFMSGLFLEVKGEGKKRKLAECAYTRVREGRNEWGYEQKQPSLMRKLRCFRKNMQEENGHCAVRFLVLSSRVATQWRADVSFLKC